jgi:nucleotide-binding universal stress UspA family protein
MMRSVDTYNSSETSLRKILVSVGRYGADDAGLKYAAKLAAESGAAVRVLHVREHELYRGLRFAMETPDDAARLVEKAVLELRGAGITATGIVRTCLVGREGANIVDEAANWGADAIVTGPGPLRSWRRGFGRGVRGQVLRLSAIPVIVPPSSVSQPRTGDVTADVKRGHERHAA